MQPLEKQSADQYAASWRERNRPTIRRTLGMVLAAGVLLFCAWIVEPVPCWAVFILVGLISFPIWQYRTEYLLFHRRLVLSGAVRPESRIRRLLWTGAVTKAIQVPVALSLAAVLLALVSQLSAQHWWVLAGDGVFLSVMVGPVTLRLEGDIRARHLRVIARRWPLFLINGIVLTLTITALDFFSVGAPDTREMAWNLVAEQAFSQARDGAGCLFWGLAAGGAAAVEALSWHFSEIFIPNLPGQTAKIIAWSLFLLRSAAVAWLYTRLLLGIGVLLDKWEDRRAGRAAESTFARSFLLTIIVLALPFIYASIKLGATDPAVFEEGVNRVADAINPCTPDEASRARLAAKLDTEVANRRQGVVSEVDAAIDQGLDRIFADVEAGVDDYLDWYFTVIGEYERLAAVFTSDAVAATSEKLQEHLFAHGDFEDRLKNLDSGVERLIGERFVQTVSTLGAELDTAPCDIGRLDLGPLMRLDDDTLIASAAAIGGVGAGVAASKALANKAAGAVVGKVAAKKSVQSGAALASKTLAKKGASAALSAGTGFTVCAPAGPMAIVCGVTAGLVTWFAVDKAAIEIDEALNREEMRTNILKVLEEQRAELGAQFKQKYYLRIDSLAALINDTVRRTFIPYRDGIGP